MNDLLKEDLLLRSKEIKIIDVTLREGEQFARAFFDTEMKLALARKLDEFGVDYIEVTSPACSPQSWEDARILSQAGLRAKILAHTRCAKPDIDTSLEAGVHGINMMYATSPILQKYSHGKNIDQIKEAAVEMTKYLVGMGVEVRFSGEDATRSNVADLERVFDEVVSAGVNRLGIPDTTGIATPDFIGKFYSHFKKRYNVDMEFHGHNDTGCTIANAYAAIYAGATHINTSVLGIGERNGITPLGGLVARLYPFDKDLLKRFNYTKIIEIDRMLAKHMNMEIPFNNYLSGDTAFYHTAGIHTNAIIKNPKSYEIFDIEEFGLERTLEVGHRLIGKNVVAKIGTEMNLNHTRDEYLQITTELKKLTDRRRYTMEEVKEFIKNWKGKA